MKEALRIDHEGNIVDVELIDGDLTELRPISGQDPENTENIIIVGYLTTARVPEGTYKPVYDFDADEFREGLTQEEIDAIRNAPQPETEAQKIARLESESVDTMLAVAEVYETSTVANATREQEAVDTMLGLAEAYEIILVQQLTIDTLTTRIAALESVGGGE